MTETAPAATLADRIKQRVHQADQERIAARADAAASVATKLAKRTDLMKQLADVETALSTLVSQATAELMTEKELAEFVGVKPSELGIRTTRRAPRKRRVTAPE